MNHILEGLDGLECNIDDILIYGTNQEEHNQRLKAVLHRLNDANVTQTLTSEWSTFKL